MSAAWWFFKNHVPDENKPFVMVCILITILIMFLVYLVFN